LEAHGKTGGLLAEAPVVDCYQQKRDKKVPEKEMTVFHKRDDVDELATGHIDFPGFSNLESLLLAKNAR